jgi:hypothetical protein
MKNEQHAAERMLKRARALGLISRTGAPVVVDQMEELIAAAAGFRNRHAWRASLQADVKQPELTPGEERQQKLDVLDSIGVEVFEDPDKAFYWLWTAPTDMCEDPFTTEDAALADAWNRAVSDTCAKADMPSTEWGALSFVMQCAMIQDLYQG